MPMQTGSATCWPTRWHKVKHSNYQVWEAGSEAGLCAVIMAPIMPSWDHGAFCRPLTDLLLARGYSVFIYDTMGIASECSDLADAAARWAEILSIRHPRIDLVVGQAYGGALIQYMLADALSDCPKVLGISAPTYCDDALRAGLGDVLQELSHSGPEAALQAMAWRVMAESNSAVPERPQSAPAETEMRFERGLSHLCTADARRQVEGFRGQVLSLYGEESRLVRGCNIILAAHSTRQRAVGLPACGMRPLTDAEEASLALIADFLDESK